MKGIAQALEDEVINMTSETVEAKTESASQQSLYSSVKESLQSYFKQLEGAAPANLYSMVLAEVEKPLLEMVLQLTNGNQSKAAKFMGISRGTLRKKMAIYNLLKSYNDASEEE